MHKNTISAFHKSLHRWYRANGRRSLPWRNTDDPYAIYISEIMLQQTQVKTVLERFYFPFMERFPSLGALAKASRNDVLQAWQGLGYYTRAINLHESAKRCKGTLPDDVDTLMTLPGIGRNTAHAIASFGFHQPVPVMEANLRRVLARIFALEKAKESEFWEKAHQLLDVKNPFDYNQAMMDIGALICRKSNPLCTECPAQTMCKGQSSPELYPATSTKKHIPIRHRYIMLLSDEQGRIYARPRSSRFLHGLYCFMESENKNIVFEGQKISFEEATPIGHIQQKYSHFTLEAEIGIFHITSHKGKKFWHGRNKLHTLPFSNAEHKILSLLKQHRF